MLSVLIINYNFYKVKKEKFYVLLYNLMFLIIKIKYGNFCNKKEDPHFREFLIPLIILILIIFKILTNGFSFLIYYHSNVVIIFIFLGKLLSSFAKNFGYALYSLNLSIGIQTFSSFDPKLP